MILLVIFYYRKDRYNIILYRDVQYLLSKSFFYRLEAISNAFTSFVVFYSLVYSS